MEIKKEKTMKKKERTKHNESWDSGNSSETQSGQQEYIQASIVTKKQSLAKDFNNPVCPSLFLS